MASTTDYKLRFEITADGNKAKAELKNVDGLIKKLGANQSLKGVVSSASSELSTFGSIATKAADSIPIPFAAAAVAITGVGLAAVNAGESFFTLVKNASEFGSELHDAADKTGLSAEAISTLKFNADNAGSSLEKVSGGVAKFGKLLGQAADGSEKAQTTLKSLGITSNDLQTAMDQAFVSIEKLPPGIEQLAASQKLFGKTGADLIPVIKQMGGSFTDAITEAKRFGVTLTEEDLKAADNFGDSLKSLGVQAKVMASKFALEFAPMITSAMNKTSKAISDHQDDIRRAASNFENAARGMIGVSNDLAHAAGKVQTEYQKMPTALQKTSDGLAALIIPGYGAVRLMQKLAEATAKYLILRGRVENSKSERGEAGLGSPNGRAGDGLNRKFGYSDPDEEDSGKSRGGGGGGGRASQKSAAEQAERERIQGIKRDTADELALRGAVDATVVSMIEKRVAESNASELQGLEQRNRVAMDTLVFKRKVLSDELAAVRGNAEEETRITREQALLEQEIKKTHYDQQTAEYEVAKKNRGAAYDALIKEIDKTQELGLELTKNLATENERFDLMTKELNLEVTRPPHGYKFNKKTGQIDEYDKPLGTRIATDDDPNRNNPIGRLQDTFSDRLQKTMQGGDLGGIIKNSAALEGVQAMTAAFSELGNAVGSAVEAFVLYGSAGASVRQVTAQILASIAQQAAVQAIYELAQGLAVLALSFFGVPNAGPSATAHFAAAATYGLIAGVTAGVGRAVAGNSMKQKGGGGGGAKGTGGATSTYLNNSRSGQQQDLPPYSRQTQDAFMSSRHQDPAPAMVARAIEKLNEKIGSMRPGDVLVAGTREKPGHIGNTLVKEVSSNAGIGRRILQKSGVS